MSLQSFPLRPGPLHGTPATNVLNGWQITSYFGGRVDPLTGRPGVHGGMDLAHSQCAGAEILAVRDGWLQQAWDSSGGGNWSSLTDDDGNYYGYGHASRYAPGSARRVKAGEVIAYVGSTGGSTGAHLHFAYRPRGSGVYRDPYDLLVEVAGGATPEPTPDPEPEDDMPYTPEQLAEIIGPAVRAELEKNNANVNQTEPYSNLQLHGDMLGLLTAIGKISPVIDDPVMLTAMIDAIRALPTAIVDEIKARL